MTLPARSNTPLVLLRLETHGEHQWLIDAVYRHRRQIESHIRRRLEMYGVEFVDGNCAYDAGLSGTSSEMGNDIPRAYFEISVQHDVRGLDSPVVFLRRFGKYNSGAPGRWLLVPDGEDAEQRAEQWAAAHTTDIPFVAVRWKGLRELTDALRSIIWSHC